MAKRTMDYDLDIILIALVAHQVFDGGTEDKVTDYAAELFDRYNAHIVKAAGDAGFDLNARKRSVVASIAAMIPATTAKEAAMDAVATFIQLFES
jgi:hypothetical protein